MVPFIYLAFMCKFIIMVYSPGTKKVFIDFGGCSRTRLSCSLYSMVKIQNYSLLQ